MRYVLRLIYERPRSKVRGPGFKAPGWRSRTPVPAAMAKRDSNVARKRRQAQGLPVSIGEACLPCHWLSPWLPKPLCCRCCCSGHSAAQRARKSVEGRHGAHAMDSGSWPHTKRTANPSTRPTRRTPPAPPQRMDLRQGYVPPGLQGPSRGGQGHARAGPAQGGLRRGVCLVPVCPLASCALGSLFEGC